MSYRHFVLCAALLAAVASLSSTSSAQTPQTSKTQTPPTTKKDSVVADSTATDSTAKAPKKSRFGGLMNKAKAVAGNKTVQAAAKNVGCTVVPGAAVASAVTGSGPCANTGIAGMMQQGGAPGGVKGAATGAVTGAVSGALTGAMGNKANALAGALGAPNATSIAAIQQMMRGNGALGGMSEAAGNALAQQILLQTMATGGTATAASHAAIEQMLIKNGAMTGLSKTQQSALIQQIIIQSAALAAMQGAAAAPTTTPKR